MAKVLVFDAEAKWARLLSETLKALGHEPVVSSDGYGVVGLALQHKPALAVLDYKLPEAAGAEIQQRLRATALGPAFPVVFVSATPKYEIEFALLDKNAVEFVGKPFKAEELGAAISALLG